MDPIVHDPKVVEHVSHKHVEEVQPVVHKDAEQTHVHPKVEHTYEHEVKPTEVHETHDIDGHGNEHEKSTFQKIKDKMSM